MVGNADEVPPSRAGSAPCVGGSQLRRQDDQAEAVLPRAQAIVQSDQPAAHQARESYLLCVVGPGPAQLIADVPGA